ncbi:hypothetical protein RFI_23530 [Reticulomyxa filosa]|uniref:Uncharacterized protein n=1 Tax=Reticulomyxa filosa TaxID=46433 RepID=X6MIK4_RETFI|nr:hypothetical protein RFI_23530 [Reticulomyxa filosa]|eukprot:ETO13838.1 hypothetical protein RFI_23530 [Reticulomyxa filosa]
MTIKNTKPFKYKVTLQLYNKSQFKCNVQFLHFAHTEWNQSIDHNEKQNLFFMKNCLVMTNSRQNYFTLIYYRFFRLGKMKSKSKTTAPKKRCQNPPKTFDNNNIRNDWQKKYGRLLEKYQLLRSENDEIKGGYQQKVKFLQNELKKIVLYAGEKLEQLETTLLWYRSKYESLIKNQNSQARKRICRSTQTTYSGPSHSFLKSKSTGSTTPKKEISVVEIDNCLNNYNTSHYEKDSRDLNEHECDNDHKSLSPKQNALFSEKTSSGSNQDISRKHKIFNHNNSASFYVGDEISAQQNALICRLRARLDTMSDILTSTKNQMNEQFVFDNNFAAQTSYATFPNPTFQFGKKASFTLKYCRPSK